MKPITLVFLTIVFVCVLQVQTGCTKSSGSGCKWNTIPNSLIFKVMRSDTVLTDNDLQNCKLFYFQDNTKKYLTDFGISSDTAQQKMGLIASRGIGLCSADSKIKTYYLEYPNGWATDTLFVDFVPPSPATNCLYLLKTVKQNGVMASVDSSFHFELPVFIIKNP